MNSAPQYADLRKVYSSLVLACWYKKTFRGTSAPYANRIENGDLGRLTSSEAWSPQKLWGNYVRSVNQGEYNFTEESRETHGHTPSSAPHITSAEV